MKSSCLVVGKWLMQSPVAAVQFMYSVVILGSFDAVHTTGSVFHLQFKPKLTMATQVPAFLRGHNCLGRFCAPVCPERLANPNRKMTAHIWRLSFNNPAISFQALTPSFRGWFGYSVLLGSLLAYYVLTYYVVVRQGGIRAQFRISGTNFVKL